MSLLLNKNSLFVFHGDTYRCLDLAAKRVDDQLKVIQMSFNIPFSTIDAALGWDDDTVFFFKGMDCIKYDLLKQSVLPGYPRKILFEWKGIWPSNVTDALKIGDKVFFYRGTQYISYDVPLRKADTGYPKPIADGWLGVWDSVDGAEYMGQDKVLFLKEAQVIQYDLAGKQADIGYPLPIRSYVQAYGINNTPDAVDADMQTIRNYISAVTAARTKITTSYLSAVHNFLTTIHGALPSEAGPNTLSVVLKAGLAMAKQLLVTERAAATGAVLRPLVDLLERISDEIDTSITAYEGEDWLNGVRLAVASAGGRDQSGDELRAQVEEEYKRNDADGRSGYLARLTNELPAIQTIEPSLVQKLELSMYTAWINRHFDDDCMSGNGYLHIQFADDDTLSSATIRSPLGDKIAAALNRIMPEAGVTRLMELDVVKNVSKGDVCVCFERNNVIRKTPVSDEALATSISDDAWQHVTQFTS